MTRANCPYTFTGNPSRVPRLTYDLPIAPTPSTLPHTTFGTWIFRTSLKQIDLTTALLPSLTRSSLRGTTPQTSPTTYHSTAFLTFFLSNFFTVISQPRSTIMLTMSTISSKAGGGKAPEEEKLNIPAFVKITNTSGFAIPASVLNRAWIALSQQIVNRNETAAGNLDNNFLAFLWNHVLGIAPVSPVTSRYDDFLRQHCVWCQYWPQLYYLHHTRSFLGGNWLPSHQTGEKVGRARGLYRSQDLGWGRL